MESISYDLTGQYGLGKQVLLSPEDFQKINGRKLFCISSGYVMIWNKESNKPEYLHRWLFDLQKGDKRVVDHIDGDRLNSVRSNLRICSSSENMCNRKKLLKNGQTSSKFKGVYLKNGKWKAHCKKNNVDHYLGCFENEIDAARAYNEKCKELHEGYAILNII